MTKYNRKQIYGNGEKTNYYDYNMLAVLVFIICFGLIMLYSASAYNAKASYEGDGMYLFRKQAIITAAGFVGMLIISQIDYHLYAPFAKILYYISIVLMMLVRWSPLGITVNGSRRWLGIEKTSFQMQPSEVAKLAVILFIPYLICELGKYINTKEGVLRVLIYGGVASFGVFYLTDNLSTAIIVAGIVCSMLFVAHPKFKPFVRIVLGGIAALLVVLLVVVMQLTKSDNFRVQRIVVWLQPDKHLDEGGYQVMQGLYAIGSGGFWGKGLGNSVQKLDAIPEVQNDMILSAICEELGIFGAIIILLLFGMLLYRFMLVAQNAPDLYGSLIMTGIFTHIALQVILNIAVVTKLIPTTGITLPFFSYGGTSVVFLMAEMGIALGVSRTIKITEN